MQHMCTESVCATGQNDSKWTWAKSKSCVAGKKSKSHRVKNILTSKSQFVSKLFHVADVASVLLTQLAQVKNVNMPGLLKHSTKCGCMLTLTCGRCSETMVCAFIVQLLWDNLGGGCVGNWHAAFAYTLWRIRDEQGGGEKAFGGLNKNQNTEGRGKRKDFSNLRDHNLVGG